MAKKLSISDLASAIEDGGSAYVTVYVDDTVIATIRYHDAMGVEDEVEMGKINHDMEIELETYGVDIEYETDSI